MPPKPKQKPKPKPKPAAPGSTRHLAQQQTLVQQRQTENVVQEQTVQTTTYTSQVQSQEIVQTIIHSSVSAIMHIRNFFPGSYFDEQWYDSSNSHTTYADYLEGRTNAKFDQKSPIKVLKRGRSSRADRLLNWLEDGVFDALKRGCLAAMKLCAHEGPDKASKIVEMWNFNFNYPHSTSALDSGSRTDPHVDMTAPSHKKVSIGRNKHQMQAFSKLIFYANKDLPDIEQQVHISLHLEFTSNCPRSYMPQWFESSSDTPIFISGETKSVDVRSHNTGHHMVSLNVYHPALQDDIEDANLRHRLDHTTLEPEGVSILLPLQTVEHGASSRRNEESSGISPHSDTQVSHRVLPGSWLRRADREIPLSGISKALESDPLRLYEVGRQPAQLNQTGPPTTGTRKGKEPIRGPIVPVPGSTSSASSGSNVPAVHGPDSQDRRIQKALMGMDPVGAQLNIPQDTQLVHDSLATQDEFSRPITSLQLKQSTINYLRSQQSIFDNIGSGPSVWITSDIRKSIREAGYEIACDCASSKEDEVMLFCCVCNTAQHLPCYGYQIEERTRPQLHVCYKCLLWKRERDVFDAVHSLAIHRRAVHVVIGNGPTDNNHLAAMLECTMQAAGNVSSSLKKKGYLVAEKRTKSRGPMIFTMCTSKEKLEQLVGEYFNPLRLIEHHFEPPREPSPTMGSPISSAGVSEKRPRDLEAVEGTSNKRRATAGGRPLPTGPETPSSWREGSHGV